MAKISLVITGDKELNKKLNRLTSQEAKKVIRTASRKALKPVLHAVKQAVPVDSGNLEDHVKIKALSRSRKHVGARVTSGSGSNENSGDAYYGSFLELGTKHIPEMGFIRFTVDRKRAETMKLYGDLIGFQLERIAKR